MHVHILSAVLVRLHLKAAEQMARHRGGQPQEHDHQQNFQRREEIRRADGQADQAEAHAQQQAGQPDGPACHGDQGHAADACAQREQEDDGEPFDEKMSRLTSELSELFAKSHELEAEIRERLGAIGYEL